VAAVGFEPGPPGKISFSSSKLARLLFLKTLLKFIRVKGYPKLPGG
jgi:hypothetical protein